MTQSMGTAARQLRREPVVMHAPLPTNTGAAFSNGGFEWADLTAAPTLAAGANGDFGQPCHWFRCIFAIKTFVLPTVAPTPSSIYIEAGDNAALTTNNRKLQLWVLPAVAGGTPTLPGSSANYWFFDLRGACGDGARQFARPGVSLGTGTAAATIAFDAFLVAGFPGAAAGDLG